MLPENLLQQYFMQSENLFRHCVMLSEMKVDENFEIRHSTKINNTILDTTEQQT